MSSNTYQKITLLVLVLCIVSPIESRYEKDRKQEKSTNTQQAAQLQPASTQVTLNLCRKDRTLSFLCHCTPEDESIKAQKAECWIISSDISRKDPQWLAFNSQTQLQHLKFSVLANGNLSFIPTDILQSLKFLRTISIEYGHVHELYSFAFGNLTLLTNISLTNNQIKIIGPYTFGNHQHLIDINLEKNEIYELDRHAFVNVPNLIRLNLNNNQLEVIQDDTFEAFSKLNELWLRNNSINKLSREIFKGLGNLKILNLSFNKLIFIGDTVFAELWSLQELELESNQIEKISERAFDGLNNLQRLNLENNRLKLLERGIFTGVPALIYLNLMKNSLETITFNNILPLMDNLVNNTSSILDITENNLICDCRLAWLIDLKNQTKNEDFKLALDEIECLLKKPKDQFHKTNKILHNAIDHPLSETEDETEYYDDEPDGKTIMLMKLKTSNLPCPEETSDPTELPLSRESIGFDMSW
ncbi:CLUMA_CG012505, isoform A, partial [Clunio marinus]